jgi:hypothetical protein
MPQCHLDPAQCTALPFPSQCANPSMRNGRHLPAAASPPGGAARGIGRSAGRGRGASADERSSRRPPASRPSFADLGASPTLALCTILGGAIFVSCAAASACKPTAWGPVAAPNGAAALASTASPFQPAALPPMGDEAAPSQARLPPAPGSAGRAQPGRRARAGCQAKTPPRGAPGDFDHTARAPLPFNRAPENLRLRITYLHLSWSPRPLARPRCAPPLCWRPSRAMALPSPQGPRRTPAGGRAPPAPAPNPLPWPPQLPRQGAAPRPRPSSSPAPLPRTRWAAIGGPARRPITRHPETHISRFTTHHDDHCPTRKQLLPQPAARGASAAAESAARCAPRAARCRHPMSLLPPSDVTTPADMHPFVWTPPCDGASNPDAAHAAGQPCRGRCPRWAPAHALQAAAPPRPATTRRPCNDRGGAFFGPRHSRGRRSPGPPSPHAHRVPKEPCCSRARPAAPMRWRPLGPPRVQASEPPNPSPCGQSPRATRPLQWVRRGAPLVSRAPLLPGCQRVDAAHSVLKPIFPLRLCSPRPPRAGRVPLTHQLLR